MLNETHGEFLHIQITLRLTLHSWYGPSMGMCSVIILRHQMFKEVHETQNYLQHLNKIIIQKQHHWNIFLCSNFDYILYLCVCVRLCSPRRERKA